MAVSSDHREDLVMSATMEQYEQTPEDRRHVFSDGGLGILTFDEMTGATVLERVSDQTWEQMPEDLRKAEVVPCHKWSVAYHEAGHVVVMAALGVPVAECHVCAFPEVSGRQNPAAHLARETGGVDEACSHAYRPGNDLAAVMYVAGATAEGIVERGASATAADVTKVEARMCPQKSVRTGWPRRTRTDGECISGIAAAGEVNYHALVREAHRAALGILVANDATLRTVAAVLHERQWVSGADLARLTASVERVSPPAPLRAVQKAKARRIARREDNRAIERAVWADVYAIHFEAMEAPLAAYTAAMAGASATYSKAVSAVSEAYRAAERAKRAGDVAAATAASATYRSMGRAARAELGAATAEALAAYNAADAVLLAAEHAAVKVARAAYRAAGRAERAADVTAARDEAT